MRVLEVVVRGEDSLRFGVASDFELPATVVLATPARLLVAKRDGGQVLINLAEVVCLNVYDELRQ
jgi:hypothetical protein